MPPSVDLAAFAGFYAMTYSNGHQNTYTVDSSGAVTGTAPSQVGQMTASGDAKCPGTPCVRIDGTYESGQFEFMYVANDNNVQLNHYDSSGVLAHTATAVRTTGPTRSEPDRNVHLHESKHLVAGWYRLVQVFMMLLKQPCPF